MRGGLVAIESPDTAVTSDFIILRVTQQIGTTGKLSADFGTTYELDAYERSGQREEQYLRMNTGLSYSFNRWFKSSLRYDFELFDSNKGNIDYTVNRVMLGLSLGY